MAQLPSPPPMTLEEVLIRMSQRADTQDQLIADLAKRINLEPMPKQGTKEGKRVKPTTDTMLEDLSQPLVSTAALVASTAAGAKEIHHARSLDKEHPSAMDHHEALLLAIRKEILEGHYDTALALIDNRIQESKLGKDYGYNYIKWHTRLGNSAKFPRGSVDSVKEVADFKEAIKKLKSDDDRKPYKSNSWNKKDSYVRRDNKPNDTFRSGKTDGKSPKPRGGRGGKATGK